MTKAQKKVLSYFMVLRMTSYVWRISVKYSYIGLWLSWSFFQNPSEFWWALKAVHKNIRSALSLNSTRPHLAVTWPWIPSFRLKWVCLLWRWRELRCRFCQVCAWIRCRGVWDDVRWGRWSRERRGRACPGCTSYGPPRSRQTGISRTERREGCWNCFRYFLK